jgi:hypothetical protein
VKLVKCRGDVAGCCGTVGTHLTSASSLAVLPALWLLFVLHQIPVSCSLSCSDTPSITKMLRFHRHACAVAAVVIVAAAVSLHPAAATVTIPVPSAGYSLHSQHGLRRSRLRRPCPFGRRGTHVGEQRPLVAQTFWRLVGGAVGFKFNAVTVKNVRITVKRSGSR